MILKPKKSKFHYHKNPTLVDVDICKLLISEKVSCKKAYKYFIGYKNDEKIKLLCLNASKKECICTKIW